MALAFAAVLVFTCVFVVTPKADAQVGGGRQQSDVLVYQGDALLLAGSYFEASERYSAAVLKDPASGPKKLAFGHSLFALGHYAYAAFNFRRGLRYMEYPLRAAVALDAVFPSRRALRRHKRDVRLYLQRFPGDHHALTVLAYTSLFGGDTAGAAPAALELLEQNPRDPFAKYVLAQLRREAEPAPLRASAVSSPLPRPRDELPPVAAVASSTTTRPPAVGGLALDAIPEGRRAVGLVTLSREEPAAALAAP